MKSIVKLLSKLGTSLLLVVPAAFSANWIEPDFPQGAEPGFPPVALYWFEVKQTPYAYRTVVTIDDGLKAAVIEARSSGYLYLFVDAEPVFQYAPSEKERHDPSRAFHIDLTDKLAPGRHAVVVSAPRQGFAIDGLIDYGHRKAHLQTDATWQVMKYPPTTIIEDEPWLLSSFEGAATPVKAGKEFTAGADFAAIVIQCLAKSVVSRFDDALWRLELLAKKGIVIREGCAHGWAGPERIHPALSAKATDLYARLLKLAQQIDELRGPLPTGVAQGFEALAQEIRSIAAECSVISEQQFLLDETRALSLAAQIIRLDEKLQLPSEETVLGATNEPALKRIAERLAACRVALTAAWGHPLNLLNVSRYDRLGWLPHPDLTDSQLGAWGLRVNPITVPSVIKADGRNWRFSTDPDESGEAEKRHTIGYNIDNQWPRITVPGSWTTVDSFKGYRGAAWYRTRLNVPAEWRGYSVTIRFQAADNDKVWINDSLVGASSGAGVRNYIVKPDVIRPDAENVLAFKVTGSGPDAGIIGSVSLSCPALAGAKTDAATAKVIASPLSPVVVLIPDGSTLELQGWADRQQPGPSQLLLPSAQGNKFRRLKPEAGYSLQRDGRLASNWVIIWMTPSGEQQPDRPVLLVFERQPSRITCAGDLVRITFDQPQARLATVRPWVRNIPEIGSDAFNESVALWQRATLAVPVNYLELTRMIKPGPPSNYKFNIHDVPQGPTLEHTIVYDYMVFKDDWDTKPLRLAPMPALGSYGIDTRFGALAFNGPRPVPLQDGGLLASYRAVPDTDRISYSYMVEPFPRLAGFTSWMFSWADTGVPGNKREVELIKSTGANCYRPQHNFAAQKSPHFPESEPRTRVQIMADYCNDHGLNYMNNIDQTLGEKREFVKTNYVKFMEKVNQHYESIARQLHDRPFFDVAYDLINEPFDHQHTAYNIAMKTLTARVRAIDLVHLCYIEPCEAWGAIEQLRLIEPTGDPLTVYSFHDYNFRLFKPADRWPTAERDISNICRQWNEAFKFAIEKGAPMHCGEFGGFDNSTDNQLAQSTLMNDFFRIFDQFGMHFNYYSGRSVFGRRADGSMALSNVVRAFREYFARIDFNSYYLPDHE